MAAAGSQGLISARYGDSPVNTDYPHTGDPERHMVLAAALYRMAPIIVLSSVWERVRPTIQSAWSAMPGRVARCR